MDSDSFLEELSSRIQGYTPKATVPDEQGWMDSHVERIFDLLPKQRLMIEVGTWKGKSALTFARRLKGQGGKLLCIDTWLGAPEFYTFRDAPRQAERDLRPVYGYPSVYYTFLDNVFLAGLQDTVVPFPISSEQGAVVLEAFSFRGNVDSIYVDASHEYEAVKKDMAIFWNLVRPGGYLFGDDYSKGWPGVVKAVDEFTAEHSLKVIVHGYVWFLHKPMVERS